VSTDEFGQENEYFFTNSNSQHHFTPRIFVSSIA